MPPPGMTPEEFESVHFPSAEVGEVKAGSRPKKSANKPMINEGGQTVCYPIFTNLVYIKIEV